MNVLCVVASWPNVVKVKSVVEALDGNGAHGELVAVGSAELD